MQIQNLFGIGLYIVYKTLNQKQSSQSVLITQEYNYSTISPDFSILQWDMVAPVGHVGAMVAPWRLQEIGTLHGFLCNREHVPTAGRSSVCNSIVFALFQQHALKISSVENFLNQSYSRFASTITTTTAMGCPFLIG